MPSACLPNRLVLNLIDLQTMYSGPTVAGFSPALLSANMTRMNVSVPIKSTHPQREMPRVQTYTKKCYVTTKRSAQSSGIPALWIPRNKEQDKRTVGWLAEKMDWCDATLRTRCQAKVLSQ
jgi:hypothetical protein